MAEPGSIRFVLDALTRFTEQHVKVITLDAVANLVEDTPRRTGWARSNWVPSIGTSADLDGTPPADDQSSAAVGQRSAEREAGIAAIVTGYRLSLGRIYITNNVPYIQRLNDGHSKQAPAGFVQAAILRAVRGAFVAGDQTL